MRTLQQVRLDDNSEVSQRSSRRFPILDEQKEYVFIKALLGVAIAGSQSVGIDNVIAGILDAIPLVDSFDLAVMLLTEKNKLKVVGIKGYDGFSVPNVLPEEQFPCEKLPLYSKIIHTRKLSISNHLQDGDSQAVPLMSEKIASHIGIPILSGGEVIGILCLGSIHPNFFTTARLERLQLFTDLTGIAIKNVQVHEKAQAFAVAEERQRVAWELHDSISQMLFSASVFASALQRVYEKTPEQLPSLLGELHDMIHKALVEMRALLHKLQSADDEGKSPHRH